MSGSEAMRPIEWGRMKESEALVERAETQLKNIEAGLESYLFILRKARLEHISPEAIEQFLLDIKDPEWVLTLAKAELGQVEIGLENWRESIEHRRAAAS
jgi:hypothetical protein